MYCCYSCIHYSLLIIKHFEFSVTGDANYSMETTNLTIVGSSQPVVSRTLIEHSGSTEVGLAQRIFWIFPQPSYAKISSLEAVQRDFIDIIGTCTYNLIRD